ncbi:MAG: CPBP family intramembrane metalloprotease [Oscillospiraceae bacterium]|nr:CPBP family intramembrane metalloprotease [Oscillospiraceae bacterium]
MKTILKNIWKIICYPLLYLVMQLVIPFGYMLVMSFVIGLKLGVEGIIAGEFTPSFDEVAGTLLSPINIIIPVIISIFITLILIFAILQREWKAEKFWSVTKIKPTPLVLCCVFGIAFNILTIFVFVFIPVQQQSPIDDLVGYNLLLELFSFALCAALIEEVIFRGIILKRLSKMMKLPIVIILQALIFGVIHFDLVQGSYAFVVGLVLGLVYIWFDSIWLVIALHCTYNATSVILTHILGETEIELLYLIIAGAAALIVSAVCLVGLYNRKLDIINGGEQ